MKRGAGLVLGGLAVILALGVLGPFAAIVAGWFMLSPDPVASTGRAGGLGAVGAGATAAAGYLADEWRAGGPARQRRRDARRDRWWSAGGWRRRALSLEHGLVLAGRGLRTVLVAAGRAAVVLPAGARAGVQAAREQQARRQAEPHDGAVPEPAGEPIQGSTGEPTAVVHPTGPWERVLARERQANEARADAETSDPGGSSTGQAPPDTNPATTGDDMSETTTAPVGSTELATTGDLRAECAVIAGLLEQAAVLGGLLKDWQTGLPEAYEGGNANGGPRTRALDEAVGSVSEAGADGQALGEALGGIRQACDQADSLGEHASAMGAGGHTKGYVPA